MYCEFSLSFLANSVSSVCLESEFNIPLATRAAAVASYDENVKIDKSEFRNRISISVKQHYKINATLILNEINILPIRYPTTYEAHKKSITFTASRQFQQFFVNC